MPIKYTHTFQDILKLKDIEITKAQGKEMSTDELLKAGIAAAKANDSVGASNLLSQVVKTDPNSELGWLWLGYCRDVPQQREYCFRKVLSINPENVEARRQIEILNHPVVSFGASNQSIPLNGLSRASDRPVVESPKTTILSDRNNTALLQPKKTNSKKTQRNNNKTFIWVGIGMIILFCIAVVGLVLFARIINLRNSAQAPSIAASVSATSIATPPPSYTPYFEAAYREIVINPIQVRDTYGFVQVTEDRNGDLTDTIQLAVTIYRNPS